MGCCGGGHNQYNNNDNNTSCHSGGRFNLLNIILIIGFVILILKAAF